jgi:hypothetical protein
MVSDLLEQFIAADWIRTWRGVYVRIRSRLRTILNRKVSSLLRAGNMPALQGSSEDTIAPPS